MTRRRLLFLAVFSSLLAHFAQAQSTLFTVEENGPRNERINFVFLSEGYTSADLPNFSAHVQNAVNYLFSKEPWKQYRSYCNLYRIEIASNQSGCDYGAAGGLRDTYFNCGFNTPGAAQLITFDVTGQNRAYNLLNQHVPEFSIPILIVNDTKYGGAGGFIAIASVNASSQRIVEHELGHTFADLGDEYDIEYTVYSPKEKPNITAQNSRPLVKWNAWVDATTPEPTPETTTYDTVVGLFEGAMYRTSGWYRPHNNSLMRNLGKPVGSVNREQFVLSIYARVGLIDAQLPADPEITANDAQTLNFSVAPKQPNFWTLQKTWKIDGVAQAGTTGSSLSIASYPLGNGSHTIAVEVVDPTDFVRNDPSQLLRQTTSWDVTLTNQPSAILAAWRQAWFGATNATGNVGDLMDPDHDGQVNLLEFAFGTNPTLQQSGPISFEGDVIHAGVPTASVVDPQNPTACFAIYGRRHDYIAAGLTYAVQFSADMLSWSTSNVAPTILADDGVVTVVSVPFPPLSGGETAQFFRIAVTRP